MWTSEGINVLYHGTFKLSNQIAQFKLSNQIAQFRIMV